MNLRDDANGDFSNMTPDEWRAYVLRCSVQSGLVAIGCIIAAKIGTKVQGYPTIGAAFVASMKELAQEGGD